MPSSESLSRAMLSWIYLTQPMPVGNDYFMFQLILIISNQINLRSPKHYFHLTSNFRLCRNLLVATHETFFSSHNIDHWKLKMILKLIKYWKYLSLFCIINVDLLLHFIFKKYLQRNHCEIKLSCFKIFKY